MCKNSVFKLFLAPLLNITEIKWNGLEWDGISPVQSADAVRLLLAGDVFIAHQIHSVSDACNKHDVGHCVERHKFMVPLACR